MGHKLKNPIPGVKKRGWLERKWFVETVGSGPPVIAAFVAAYKAWLDPSITGIAWIAAAGAIWLLMASLFKIVLARKQDAEDDEARNHDGLKAALHVIHATAAQLGSLSAEQKDGCLRATFHRVVPPLNESDHIEQIVDYVGGDGGGKGRTFPIRSGITGKAIRERDAFVMDRRSESYEDYKKELVAHWNYTDHDVKNITSDRYSAIAVPIQSRNGQDILGVVYLDCKEKNFFSSPAMIDAVHNACLGIARYTGERYV